MGNIFSYYFKSNNIKYNDSLLDPLTKDIDEDIQYASLLDIQSINGQVGLLEETTQSSLKNISKDVKYLFEEFEKIKRKLDECENICKQTYLNSITENNETSIYKDNSVYLDPYNENNDNSENEDTY